MSNQQHAAFQRYKPYTIFVDIACLPWHITYECAPTKNSFMQLLQEIQLGIWLVRMSSNKAIPSSLKNHHIKKGNSRDSVYIFYVSEYDAVQDLMEASSKPTTIKVVLTEEMGSKVFDITDKTHEQFFLMS